MVKAVRRLIEDGQVGAAVGREDPRGQGNGLGEGALDGPARGRGHAVRPRGGGEHRRPAEVVRGVVDQDGHLAGSLVGDGDVGQAVAGEVGHRDVRRGDAGGQRDRRRESAGGGLQGDGHAVVQGVGGHQVLEAVPVQVGRREARRQGGGRERGLPRGRPAGCDGVERDREHELAGRHRDVVVGVGRGDGRSRADPQHGDRPRGPPGVEDHRRGEDAGVSGHPPRGRGCRPSGRGRRCRAEPVPVRSTSSGVSRHADAARRPAPARSVPPPRPSRTPVELS